MRGKLQKLQQMLATRKRGSTPFAAENGYPDLGQCGGGMDDIDGEGGVHQICSFFVDRQLVDHITLERIFGTDAARSCRRSKQTGLETRTGQLVV